MLTTLLIPTRGTAARPGLRRGQPAGAHPPAHRLHLWRRARPVLAAVGHRQPALLRQPVPRRSGGVPSSASPTCSSWSGWNGREQGEGRGLFARHEAAPACRPHAAARSRKCCSWTSRRSGWIRSGARELAPGGPGPAAPRARPSCSTTHYMFEADALCQRIAVINHGRIIALDTPEGLEAARQRSLGDRGRGVRLGRDGRGPGSGPAARRGGDDRGSRSAHRCCWSSRRVARRSCRTSWRA